MGVERFARKKKTRVVGIRTLGGVEAEGGRRGKSSTLCKILLLNFQLGALTAWTSYGGEPTLKGKFRFLFISSATISF